MFTNNFNVNHIDVVRSVGISKSALKKEIHFLIFNIDTKIVQNSLNSGFYMSLHRIDEPCNDIWNTITQTV